MITNIYQMMKELWIEWFYCFFLFNIVVLYIYLYIYDWKNSTKRPLAITNLFQLVPLYMRPASSDSHHTMEWKKIIYIYICIYLQIYANNNNNNNNNNNFSSFYWFFSCHLIRLFKPGSILYKNWNNQLLQFFLSNVMHNYT